MEFDDIMQIKKTSVTNLKAQCDQLNEKITSIQQLTKNRWDNIDKIINIFKTAIVVLIILNLVILFFVVFL